jgi:hypothetical protein
MNTQPDPKDPLTKPVPVKEPAVPNAPAKEPPPAQPAESAGEAGGKEFGGQKGPEPTRFGDWENKGRCTDF